jgi:hypothetical protein
MGSKSGGRGGPMLCRPIGSVHFSKNELKKTLPQPKVPRSTSRETAGCQSQDSGAAELKSGVLIKLLQLSNSKDPQEPISIQSVRFGLKLQYRQNHALSGYAASAFERLLRVSKDEMKHQIYQ